MDNHEDVQTELRPVVITDEQGEVIDRTVMNGKAFRKSLEQGELWTYHEQTGRVLPPSGGLQFLEMTEVDGEIRVVLAAADAERYRKTDAAAESGEDVAPARDTPSHGDELDNLQQTVHERRVNPKDGSYTTYLFSQGGAKIRKKVGEEGIEVCLAADPTELVSESADLMFHLAVLLEHEGRSFADVMEELRRRRLEG